MKRIVIAASLVFIASIVFAHPPVINSMVYDPATKILTITILHNINATQVKDITRHFIKSVSVMVNGNDNISQAFSTQENPNTEVLVYKMLLQPGDKVSVKANCSLAGSGTSDLTIMKPAESTGGGY